MNLCAFLLYSLRVFATLRVSQCLSSSPPLPAIKPETGIFALHRCMQINPRDSEVGADGPPLKREKRVFVFDLPPLSSQAMDDGEVPWDYVSTKHGEEDELPLSVQSIRPRIFSPALWNQILARQNRTVGNDGPVAFSYWDEPQHVSFLFI